MNIGEQLHGFSVTRKTEVPEIDGTLYELEYEKNGARLIFLDRPDNNKTFSIAFKTVPTDSTGVFHIIEHSVLCGSAKYPVKEPFVELLKGSLSTFLNALTFNDKTMYPISSRNDKDFLNLVDVYLDAVLHPAILTNSNIFRQEGWHYELSEETGELTTKGVVLNEMRGAYSSVDDLSSELLSAMLYPDVCYGRDSGGEPSAIVKLTYEDFIAQYKKYYHPSNSYIFLDGSIDVDATLSLVGSFLAPYEKLDCDIHIGTQKPIAYTERRVPYEIGENEDPSEKFRLLFGYPFAMFDEDEKAFALSILLDAIAGSNEAPLKKAMLDSGLCEDFSLSPFDGIKQSSLFAEIRNCKEEDLPKLEKLFYDTVADIVKKGIDKKLLEAAESICEFRMREKDFGSYPKGLIYNISVLSTWLYGGKPEMPLSVNHLFDSIRAKIDSDYFEKLLSELILDQKGYAKLTLVPSPTLGAEKREAEKASLAAYKASLSEAEIAKIAKENEILDAWQKTADTKAALDTIPALSVSDVSDKPDRIPTEITSVGKNRVIYHDIKTDGILYLSLLFDISHLDADGIFRAGIISRLLSNLPTEKHDALTLQTEMKNHLGAYSVSTLAVRNGDKTVPYLNVAVSVLESKKNEMLSLIREILLSTVYTEKNTVRNLLKQIRIDGEETVIGGGHVAAIGRASAMLSSEGAIYEYAEGFESYLRVKALEKNFDAEGDAFLAGLSDLAKSIFAANRLTVAYTGAQDGKLAEELIALFPKDADRPAAVIPPLPNKPEGIVTPAGVSFAVIGDYLPEKMKKIRGNLLVIRNLLNYEYLWGAVRVQGGAYGVGFIARPTGMACFYSFRDPTACRTLGCYAEASKFLREFAASGEDLTKYIIGSVGDSDPLMTPREAGSFGTLQALRGNDYESECATRRAILSTGKDDLLAAAEIIDSMMKNGAICVIGGKDKIDACGEKLAVKREL